MKKFLVRPLLIYIVVALLSAQKIVVSLPASCIESGTGFFLPRPQGFNSAVFFNPYQYKCCDTLFPAASFYLGYRYSQTFKNKNIARCLFGCDTIHLSGSKAVIDNPETDWLADYFGLSPNFKGKVHWKPKIKNNIIDFSVQFNLGHVTEYLKCGYVRFNTSLVHSNFLLNICTVSERVPLNDFINFPACYMGNNKAQATQDLNTALSGNFLFGDMQTNWNFNKIIVSNRCRKDTKLANIDTILGYDFLRCNSYHLGAFVKAVAPTGTRPNNKSAFEVIIGNGHHWELGGGIDLHADLWACNNRCFQVYFTGSVTHLFNDTQYRTFDLKNITNDNLGISGKNSRFILLKEFDHTGNYTGNLIHALNFTTRPIKSSFDVQGDASLRLLYHYWGWALGLGYTIYGRSQEKITNVCKEINHKHFGIKGTTGVCARAWKQGEGLTGTTHILNATTSRARIFNDPLQNSVDNSIFLADGSDIAFVTWDSPSALDTPTGPNGKLIIAQDSQIKGQPAPVILTTSDINFKGISSQISHTLFAHIGYQGDHPENIYYRCWQPYFNVGGEIEFAQNGNCKVCIANQWGIWIQGGVNF